MVCFLCFSQNGWAIVNVSQSVTDSKKDGVTNTAYLGLNGAKGNTDTSSLKADLLSRWKHGDYTDFFLLEHAYGKSNREVNTARTFVHLRHRKQWSETWAYEVFVQTGESWVLRLN